MFTGANHKTTPGYFRQTPSDKNKGVVPRGLPGGAPNIFVRSSCNWPRQSRRSGMTDLLSNGIRRPDTRTSLWMTPQPRGQDSRPRALFTSRCASNTTSIGGLQGHEASCMVHRFHHRCGGGLCFRSRSAPGRTARASETGRGHAARGLGRPSHDGLSPVSLQAVSMRADEGRRA